MRILHLEDNPADAELVRIMVKAEWPDCEIKLVSNRFVYTGELQISRYDLIVSDFTLSGFDGMDALNIAKSSAPDTSFIFLSGTIGEDRAIEAVKAGAQDYVLKDRMKRLVTAIRRALRETEERKSRTVAERRVRELVEMVNQAREAIIITDLDDCIVSWNAGAQRLLGWKEDEVMGRCYELLFRPETGEALRAARLELTATGEWSGELRLHNLQGVPVIVESRQTLVLDDAGQPKARLSTHSDITDRKRLEEHFLRAQRVENIGLLAAGIAHDLNNVLAPMLMAAPMLREWVREPAGAEIVEMLEKSAERGAGLVRQILSFTRGTSGEPRIVQMKDLVRDLAVLISSTFPKNIRLDEYVAPDLWPVRVSAIQIHQVLLNLCVNARDAMPQGGILRLRLENTQLSPATGRAIEGGRGGAFVVFHVEDNGTGIPSATLARIWEPFFTTKESGKGTGLGLSTVRGILKNHGGFIEVHSEPGRGTTFRAYLPVLPGHGVEINTDAAKRLARGNGEAILIVDDEADIRDMTAAMLMRQNYRVMVAGDGSEAIELFRQHHREIRLVLTDVHMPGVDGPMLTTVLQRINPAVKILVMSGSGDSDLTAQTTRIGNGVFPCLSKPFKLDALLRVVSGLLSEATPIARVV